MLVSTRTNGFVVKVAVAAVFTVGGTTLAAETGSLPRPAQQVAHDLFGGLGVPPLTSPGAPTRDADDDRDAGTPTASPKPTRRPDGDERPALDLCRQYDASRQDDRSEPLDPDDLRRLATIAGAATDLDGYCAKVLADQSGDFEEPTDPASPTSTATPREDSENDRPTAGNSQ